MIYWKLHLAVLSVHQISCSTFDTMVIEYKLLTLRKWDCRLVYTHGTVRSHGFSQESP